MKFVNDVLIIIAMLLMLTGCGGEEGDFRSSVAKPVLKTTDKMLDALLAGDEEKAQKLLIPELKKANGLLLIKDTIEKLQVSPAISVPPHEVVSYAVRGEVYGSHHDLAYQIQREQGWVLVYFEVDEVYKRFYGITAIEYRFLPSPLQEINAFTFEGKPWLHYAALTCCAVLALVVLVSLILLLRTKTKKPWIWWFWCFFICIGFVRISFNWTSGQFSFDPVGGIGVQILHHLGWVINVIHESRYEPWYIQGMFPLGAVLFLWRRKSLQQRAEEIENTPPE